MTAALTALFAATPAGGTIILAPRAYSCSLQSWATAYSAGVATAVKIQGAGAGFNGAWGAPEGATTVTFTYSGSGAAMMDFQHIGTIEICGIQFIQANTGKPFLLTTNATPNLHDNVWSGGGTGVTCATDAIVLGGTGTTVGSGDTAPYQGYQGDIYRNFFDGIRRPVLFQEYANSVQVHGNTISLTCGSNLYQGSAFEMLGSGSGSCSGNAVYGNCIECTHYSFAVRAQYAVGNTLGPNGLFDMSTPWIAGYYLGPNAGSNEVIDGERTTVSAPLCWDLSPGSNNRQRNAARGSGQYERFSTPVGFYGTAGPPQSFYFGQGVIGVEKTGNQAYWETLPGVNPYPQVALFTIAATQFTDGNLVSGSQWVTSLTAAFALADVGQAIGATGIPSQTQIMLTVTATTAFPWQASRAYAAGDVIRPASANAHLYQCAVAGTTAASQPVFPVNGSTVTDGGVTWQDLGTSAACCISNPATATASGVTIGISRAAGTSTEVIAFERTHIRSQGSAPSGAAGAGAGSSPSAISATGTDLAFTFSITTGGSGTAAGAMFSVAPALGWTAAPHFTMTAGNSATASLMAGGFWLTTTGGGTVTASFVNAPVISTAYVFAFTAIQ